METLFDINRRLKDIYGTFDTTEYPFFRVVWSNNEFEKRLVTHTKEGLELSTPVVQELPKYKQWAADKYILEHLVAIPEEHQIEMLGKKLSYEPIWTFVDKHGNALPPAWRAIEVILKSMRDAIETAGKGPKYKDEYAGLNSEELVEKRELELKQIEEELFGNETSTSDSLMQDSGVGYGIRQRNDKVN